MPTFIALQCFHCSTMQVKQQKKSSNKWTCVICNEKQSVRKVFAQSLAAKDVRHFVQNFNMSRQLSQHQQHFISEELQVFDSQNTSEKKRTDWTEYIDDDEDGDQNENVPKLTPGDGFYPVLVTELPKPLFKKPRLKEYPANKHGREKLFKPQFPGRSNTNIRHANCPSTDNPNPMDEIEQTSCERGAKSKKTDFAQVEGICSGEEENGLQSNRESRWGNFRAQFQDQNNSSNIMGESIIPPTKEVGRSVSTAQCDNSFAIGTLRSGKGQVSKWASFITEEDDDHDLKTDSRDLVVQDKNNVFDLLMKDERVEDDIHPDFL